MADSNVTYKISQVGAEKVASSFKKIVASIGAIIAGRQLFIFAKESVLLASKVEGVENAFRKLNRPNLLDNLKIAVRGTVDDFQLMQTTMRASNFKIPLDELATLLEFATKRASQTGESVDYLVNSIVDGIGRKSGLVLDNLGISLSELQKEMKLTGDFAKAAANIVNRELASMGDVALTTADEIAQLNVQFENFKVVMGQFLIPYLKSLTSNMANLNEEAKDKSFTDWLLATSAYIAVWPIHLINNAITIINELFSTVEKIQGKGEFLSQWFVGFKETNVLGEVELIKASIESTKLQLDKWTGSLSSYQTLLQDLNTLQNKLKLPIEEVNEEIEKRLWLFEKIRLKQIENFNITKAINDEIRSGMIFGGKGLPFVGEKPIMKKPDALIKDAQKVGRTIFEGWSNILVSNMNTAWAEIFGEANSLFEQLINSMVDLLVKDVFAQLLNFLPGGGILSGVLSLFSGSPGGGGGQQTIVLQMGSRTMGEWVLEGNREIQELRLVL